MKETFKYNRIDSITFKNNDFKFLLLTGKSITKDMEILLTDDLWFNEEENIINRKTVKDINSLEELMSFIKENNIIIDSNRVYDDILICGGGEDFYLDKNLIGKWCY